MERHDLIFLCDTEGTKISQGGAGWGHGLLDIHGGYSEQDFLFGSALKQLIVAKQIHQFVFDLIIINIFISCIICMYEQTGNKCNCHSLSLSTSVI